MRLSWMLHATHENAASIYLFVLGVILPARYPAIADQTGDTAWAAIFPWRKEQSDEGFQRVVRLLCRVSRRARRRKGRPCRPARCDFARHPLILAGIKQQVKGQPEPTRWPARAKVRGRRQHDSFGASSLFRVRIFPGVLEILTFAILLITHMRLELPAI